MSFTANCHNFYYNRTHHNLGQYLDGDVHTQNIEPYLAIVKRAKRGMYHW